LDVKAMAELLKMTEASVRKAKERGHLPAAAKIPGVGLRWRRSDVETWLERRFETAAAAP
jgi:predicted DNA-binding transcriptional regulator AlpA